MRVELPEDAEKAVEMIKALAAPPPKQSKLFKAMGAALTALEKNKGDRATYHVRAHRLLAKTALTKIAGYIHGGAGEVEMSEETAGFLTYKITGDGYAVQVVVVKRGTH